MTQNKLLWIVVGVLLVMQVGLLYYVMQQQKQIVTVQENKLTTTDVLIKGKHEVVSNTDTRTPADSLTAGSDIKYKQGKFNSYTNGTLLFTTFSGKKESVSISSNTKVIKAVEAKQQNQLDAELDEYVKQLEILHSGGEKNIEKIKVFESPAPYIEIPINPNDFKEGDTISVVYVSTKQDGSYDAIRIVLIPGR